MDTGTPAEKQEMEVASTKAGAGKASDEGDILAPPTSLADQVDADCGKKERCQG